MGGRARGITTVARRARRLKGAQPDPRLQAQARALLGRGIDFVDSPDFSAPDAAKAIVAPPPSAAPARRAARPEGLPAYMALLYEVPLLTAEEERALFRRMNFLRHEAARLREALDAEAPDAGLMARIEGLLAESDATRDRIARANLRLVVSIARKFASDGQSFDEFVSEGNFILLKAIEKFDYTRGFRFSTYATHAIRRSHYRRWRERRRDRDRTVAAAPDLLNDLPDREPVVGDALDVPAENVRQLLEQMRARLDSRELFIIEARYGLRDEEAVPTLQTLARRMGICKERVRQLQNRALDKLREMAREIQPAATEPGAFW